MFFWFAFAILYIPLLVLYPTKIIHKDRFDKKKKYVVASNHFSNADSLIYDVKFRKRFRYVSKIELFKTKFSAWIMRQIGAIAVDRKNISPSAFKEISPSENFPVPAGTHTPAQRGFSIAETPPEPAVYHGNNHPIPHSPSGQTAIIRPDGGNGR